MNEYKEETQRIEKRFMKLKKQYEAGTLTCKNPKYDNYFNRAFSHGFLKSETFKDVYGNKWNQSFINKYNESNIEIIERLSFTSYEPTLEWFLNDRHKNYVMFSEIMSESKKEKAA